MLSLVVIVTALLVIAADRTSTAAVRDEGHAVEGKETVQALIGELTKISQHMQDRDDDESDKDEIALEVISKSKHADKDDPSDYSENEKDDGELRKKEKQQNRYDDQSDYSDTEDKDLRRHKKKRPPLRYDNDEDDSDDSDSRRGKKKRPPLREDSDSDDDRDSDDSESRRGKKKRPPLRKDEDSDDDDDSDKNDFEVRGRKKKRPPLLNDERENDDSSNEDKIESLRLAARDIVMTKLRAIVDKAAAEVGREHKQSM